MKRKTAVAGISFFAALFCASFMSARFTLLLSSFFIILCGVSILIDNKSVKLLLIFIPCAFAFAVYSAFLVNDYQRALSYDGKVGYFSGKVIESNYIANDLMTVSAKGRIDGKTKATVTFFLEDRDLDYGDTISLKAEFSEIINNAEFNGKDYNFSQGIYLNGNAVDGFSYAKGEFSLVREIKSFSNLIYERIRRTVGGNEGAFLGAMLCGNTDDLENSLKTDLFRMGIGHIFSVSGTHLVIITLLFGYILELTSLSRRGRLLILELIVIAFTVFAGMSPSVVRAAIMTSIINLSRAARRHPDPLTTISLCAVLMTIFSPYQVRSASFLLSLTGAFAITCVSPAVVKYISYSGRFKKIFNTFLSMCIIWVCNLPLAVVFFNETSIVSPIMNMLFVPLCTVGLVLCVFASLMCCNGALAEGLLELARIIVKPILLLSEIVGDIKISYIPLGYDFIRYSVLIALAVVIILAMIKRNSVFIMRTTAIATAAVLVLISSYTYYISGVAHIYYVFYKNSFAMVLNIERKAVIIDKDAKVADAVVRLLESKGIVEVTAVIAFEEMENTRAAYYKKLDFCQFDVNNCYKAAKIDGMSSLGFDIYIDESKISLSNDGLGVTAVYGEDYDYLSASEETVINLNDGIIYPVGENATIKIDDDSGGVVSMTFNDKEMKFGRVKYGFDD